MPSVADRYDCMLSASHRIPSSTRVLDGVRRQECEVVRDTECPHHAQVAADARCRLTGFNRAEGHAR
jgi:hypothetical protein